MPSGSDVELRDRALVACALLTGARVSALITLKLKHVRADRLGIEQDAREVHTKFSKTQTTFFFPVGEEVRATFLDYVDHLKNVLLWGPDDPLFPATRQTTGADHQFHLAGLQREHWKTPDPVRTVFKRAFAAAQLPYFSPHTFRNCLMNWGERVCRTPEELKAFSQNLGHDEVRTSMTSYGGITSQRQLEILSGMSAGLMARPDTTDLGTLLEDPRVLALFKALLAKDRTAR